MFILRLYAYTQLVSCCLATCREAYTGLDAVHRAGARVSWVVDPKETEGRLFCHCHVENGFILFTETMVCWSPRLLCFCVE